jgi:hypothetical protein
MKRIIAIALFTAASTLAVANAFAQDHAIKATMPFGFAVGNKVMQPGTYTINPVTNNVIGIRNLENQVSILNTSTPDSNQSQNGAVLVFDKIGGDYFLREVLGGSAGAVNVNLPLSASEERVRKQESHAKNINQISIQGIAGD